MQYFRRVFRFFFRRLSVFLLLKSRSIGFSLFVLRGAPLWHVLINNNLGGVVNILRRLNSKHGPGRVVLTDTGVAHIYCQDFVYFIPCCSRASEALQAAFDAWAYIVESDFSSICDYSMHREVVGKHVVYRLELLQPIFRGEVSFKDVECLLPGMISENQFDGIDFDNAVRFLKNDCGLSDSEMNKFIVLPERGVVGPFHGDMHEGNFMKNRNGELVLIDLDRFQKCGPRVVDAIHFYVRNEEVAAGRSWGSIVLELLKTGVNDWSKNELIAYFLYRVGAELRGQDNIDKTYTKTISKLAFSIVKIISTGYR